VTLRVLQALGGGHVGGTEAYVFSVAPRLLADGVAVEVSLLDGHGRLSEQHRDGAIPIHDLTDEGRGLLAVARRFRRLLIDGHFDLVQMYGIRMATLGRVVSRTLATRPVMVHGIQGLHVTVGDPSSLRTRVALSVERRFARWTDAYLTNSQGAVEFMTARGLPAEKFEAIVNGLDLDEWPLPPQRRQERAPVAVCVANFKPVKRQEDLVDAMAILSSRGIPMTCEFAGAGDTLPAVRARAVAGGVGDRVRFLGTVAPGSIQGLLAGADIAVLPSATEGMPVALLEAMAAGLPVVATDVPGTRELVADGVTGRLVPVGRPDRLAAALAELVRDPELRYRFGCAGRERVERSFSMQENVRRHAEAYRRLVAAHRA
jgi:glycosyltransferase involved in cell wall biosynthesis